MDTNFFRCFMCQKSLIDCMLDIFAAQNKTCFAVILWVWREEISPYFENTA